LVLRSPDKISFAAVALRDRRCSRINCHTRVCICTEGSDPKREGVITRRWSGRREGNREVRPQRTWRQSLTGNSSGHGTTYLNLNR